MHRIKYLNEKYILNPLSEAPIIEDIYYSEKIFLNYQKLILFEIGFIIFICFITLIFYIQNNPKDTIKFGFNEKTKEKEIQKVKVIMKIIKSKFQIK